MYDEYEAETENNPVDGMFEERLVDFTKKEEVIQKRKEDLHQIKALSSQINEMAKDMAQDVERQGCALNQIEDNIVEIKEQVIKAQEITEEANEQSKGNNKKICCIVTFVVIFVAFFITIAVFTLFPKNEQKTDP